MTSTPAKTEKSSLPSVAEDPRWARIVARDKTSDGYLWYSVYTTGVYCRPSCPSRTANPNNVRCGFQFERAVLREVDDRPPNCRAETAGRVIWEISTSILPISAP